MRFTLNRYQTWLFCLPIFLISVVRNLHFEVYAPYFKNLEVIRVIWLFNASLITCYQAYLVIGFLNYINSKSLLIKINTWVAPVFFTGLACVSLYKTFLQPALFEVDVLGRAIAPSMGVFGWGILALLVLSIINIVYTNNKVVANRVALLRDIEEQLYAKYNFIQPLKDLLSAIYGIIFISAATSFASKFIQGL